MTEPLNLPDILEPFRAQIEASRKPCIRITATPDDHSGLLDSKFGGYPYLPIGAEYPKDSRGQPLTLLAQLNFAEIPPLEPYPTKGILQFYIPFGEERLDDAYGLDYRHPEAQKDWRIVWFQEPDETIAQTDFSFLPDDETMRVWTPMYLTYKWPKGTRGFARRMRFTPFAQPVTECDYRFELLFPGENEGDYFFKQFRDRVDPEKVYSLYRDLAHEYEHQIGGYPSFEQLDPRLWHPQEGQLDPKTVDPGLVLLQVASDDYFCWGDVGIANWFITNDDLINREFSRVRYHWDGG